MIDAGDFLRDPEAHLRWLCDWLGIEFTDRMLPWPAGPRDSDGVWAPYWYDAVSALDRLRAVAPPRGRPVAARRRRRGGLPAGVRRGCTPGGCGSDWSCPSAAAVRWLRRSRSDRPPVVEESRATVSPVVEEVAQRRAVPVVEEVAQRRLARWLRRSRSDGSFGG